jgi:hypothetical protein
MIWVSQTGHRHRVGGRQSNAVGWNTVVCIVMVIGTPLVIWSERTAPTTDTMQQHRAGVESGGCKGRRPPATAGVFGG